MAGTQLTIFDDKAGMPASLADLGDAPNVVGRDKINQLSFRGKVWRVIVDGEENIVKNSKGDPVGSVNVIVLDYTKKRSRAFYSGGYEEGKTSAPTCWSREGEVPDKEVPASQKQAPACASCPQAMKGAKTTEAGKAVSACGQFKRAVVVPLADPSFVPLLLKIPQTSMWDKDNKENEAAQFYAFDQYMDMLKSKGVAHTARVVAKIKFDTRTSYPKLLFNPAQWTPDTVVPAIKTQLADNKEVIEKLLHGAFEAIAPETSATPDEFESPATGAEADAAATAAKEATAKAAAAAKKPPSGRPAAAKPAEPVKAAEPAPAAAPAAKAADPDDDVVMPTKGATIEATATSKTVEAAEPATAEAPAAAGLNEMLTNWDD